MPWLASRWRAQTAAAVGLDFGVRDEGRRHGLILQNVNAQHPPHKEEGDDGHYHVANPLPGGFRFSAVLHGVIVAGWGPLGAAMTNSNGPAIRHLPWLPMCICGAVTGRLPVSSKRATAGLPADGNHGRGGRGCCRTPAAVFQHGASVVVHYNRIHRLPRRRASIPSTWPGSTRPPSSRRHHAAHRQDLRRATPQCQNLTPRRRWAHRRD